MKIEKKMSCGGKKLTPEEKEAAARSKKIDRTLKPTGPTHHKVLLLGTGNAGKSTCVFFIIIFSLSYVNFTLILIFF